MLKDILKRKIEEKNISISALERMADLKPNAIRNILSGASKNPGLSTMMALAKILECGIEELTGDDSPPKTPSYQDNRFLEMDLLLKCATSIRQICTEKSIQLKYKDFMAILDQVYFYSLKTSPQCRPYFCRVGY